MDLSDLIEPKAVVPALKANSKKQLLQLLAEKAAAVTGLPEREVFDTISSVSVSALPVWAMALPFLTANFPEFSALRACSPVWRHRSTSRPSTISRLT